MVTRDFFVTINHVIVSSAYKNDRYRSKISCYGHKSLVRYAYREQPNDKGKAIEKW